MRAKVAELARRLRGPWGRAVIGALALAGVVAIAAGSRSQPSVGVLKVRVGGDFQQTRIIVELDRPTHGTLKSAPQGREIALQLSHVDAPGRMQGQGTGLIQRWRVEPVGGGARVRLDLAAPGRIRGRFLLPPGDNFPAYRYIVDVEPAGASPAAPRQVQDVDFGAVEAGRKVVVIDPGHGGKDPGAHGVSAHEKDLTLAAARALRDRLEQSGRYKVVLTRDTDAYVPLEERVKIARRVNADLFISLHADSDPNPQLRGATVYTLSDKGTDLVVDRMFHKPDWFIDMDLPGSDQAVNRILLDLTQRRTRSRSSEFAELLLEHIQGRTELMRRSHRGAGFVVLLAPDVPAVLLEMGFITNPQDEQEMSDPVRRQRVMAAVGDAIDAYFQEQPKTAAR